MCWPPEAARSFFWHAKDCSFDPHPLRRSSLQDNQPHPGLGGRANSAPGQGSPRVIRGAEFRGRLRHDGTWPSPPRSPRVTARSTPTSPASSAPTRGSSRCAQAACGQLRRDAGARCLRRKGASATLGSRSRETTGVKLHVRSTFSDGDGTWVNRGKTSGCLRSDHLRRCPHLRRAVYRVQSVDAPTSSRRSPRGQASNVDRSSRPARDRLLGRRSATGRRGSRARPRLGDCDYIEGCEGEPDRRRDEEPSRDRGPHVRTAPRDGVEARFIVTSPIKISSSSKAGRCRA